MGAQVLANALAGGCLYAIVGLSFWIAYIVRGFFDLAHAAIITCGAYFALLGVQLGLPLFLSVALGLAGAGALGRVNDVFVFRPLDRRRASPPILMLASLALMLILQNLVSVSFGDQTRVLRSSEAGAAWVWGVMIPVVHWWVVAVAIGSTLVLALVLHVSDYGLKVRAIAMDKELAVMCGVPASSITATILFWSAGLAGLAGVLHGFDTDLTPVMGFSVLLPGVVAALFGGQRGPVGILIAALGLSALEELAGWAISGGWQDAVVYFGLLLLLAGRLVSWPVGQGKVEWST